MVAPKGVAGSELNEPMVAPEIDHKGLQILDILLCQLGAEPIHQCLHHSLPQATYPPNPRVGQWELSLRAFREMTMTNEKRKTRAQYLNSLAVTVLTVSASMVISGVAPAWIMLLALAASVTLHAAAVRIVK